MKKCASLLFLLLFTYLLLFPETAVSSARDGLLLWYHSIVPTLFPFMLLCTLALRLGLLNPFLRLLERPVHTFFGCSGYGAFAVLTGFVCGFPMGAKTTADLLEQDLIGQEEADFLCGFVNNVSPAFLISFVAADQLQRPELKYVIIGNVLGSSLLYGLLSSISFRRKNAGKVSDTVLNPAQKKNVPDFFQALDTSIQNAAENTIRLCAYLIMFSILTGAAMYLIPGRNPVLLILLSMIEVTNGVRLLASAPFSFPVRFLLICALCTFGGFSALAQSAGIAKMNRKRIFLYIKSRAICTLLSVLISLGILLFRSFLIF